MIGRKWSDAEVQSDMFVHWFSLSRLSLLNSAFNRKHWPFKVVAKEAGKPVIEVEYRGETKSFTPEEISFVGTLSL